MTVELSSRITPPLLPPDPRGSNSGPVDDFCCSPADGGSLYSPSFALNAFAAAVGFTHSQTGRRSVSEVNTTEK